MRIVHYSTPATRSLSPLFGFTNRSPWSGLETEIDRLFETALSGVASSQARTGFPVDLHQDKDNTYVRAELPGVNKEDIGVEVTDGFLTIQASRKTKVGDREESTSFSRSIMLGDEVQADKVSASYENGVLSVTVPKQEASKPKKITVSVN